MPIIPKGPYLEFEKPIVDLANRIEDLLKNTNVENEDVKELVSKKEKLQSRIQKKLTPWDKVELARRPGRPYTLDYANNLFTDFIELHGDRRFRDDPAIVTGLAKLDEQSVIIIGNQKGKDTQDCIRRNFGSAHPEGYRKASRIMKLAEKFKIPIVSFIDTPGAYPGIGAEERGQAQAIAENLKTMAVLKVPIIVTVIGEGASGGALGIGVGDRLFMLENSWYSVISPEGCAAILWGDNAKKQEMSSVMKMTPDALNSFGIVDKIIKEPLGGAHWDPDTVYVSLKKEIKKELKILLNLPIDELISQRLAKYTSIGFFSS